MRFKLLDGQNHAVDSSEYAFQQAAEGAMEDVSTSDRYLLVTPLSAIPVCDLHKRVYTGGLGSE